MHYPLSKSFIGPPDTGFTIIEVLMSLAIFSIGLLAMSALMSSSLMATGKIGIQTEAWTVLEDHAESLKAMAFYANDTNPSPTTFAQWTTTLPDLVAGNQTRLVLNNRYRVHWQVVNDLPIPAVTMPQPAATSPVIEGLVPAGVYTVSKTISVQVTLGNNQGIATPPVLANILASCQFVKTWVEGGELPYR